MPARAVKVAITIPENEFRQVEAIRKQLKTTRSAVILRALEHWLAAQRAVALDRQDQAAYRRRPDTRPEIDVQRVLAMPGLMPEEW
jgi:hypothetical protein